MAKQDERIICPSCQAYDEDIVEKLGENKYYCNHCKRSFIIIEGKAKITGDKSRIANIEERLESAEKKINSLEIEVMGDNEDLF